MRRISFDLRGSAVESPPSTGLGDRLRNAQSAVSFCDWAGTCNRTVSCREKSLCSAILPPNSFPKIACSDGGILLDCRSGWVLHVRPDAKDFDLLQTVSSIQRAIRRGGFLCDDSELLWELFVGCLSGLSEFRVRKLTGQKLACFLIILVYDVPKNLVD